MCLQRINYSKPFKELIKGKKFLVSHPQLKYLKNSREKNYTQRLINRENVIEKKNCFINLNVSSKKHKNAINYLSAYVNRSMDNFEKLKGHY